MAAVRLCRECVNASIAYYQLYAVRRPCSGVVGAWFTLLKTVSVSTGVAVIDVPRAGATEKVIRLRCQNFSSIIPRRFVHTRRYS